MVQATCGECRRAFSSAHAVTTHAGASLPRCNLLILQRENLVPAARRSLSAASASFSKLLTRNMLFLIFFKKGKV